MNALKTKDPLSEQDRTETNADAEQPKSMGILKRRSYLYITEFFSGMSVMAAELGASRLIAPYFSSSQIVWTIIIGTIMIAMALGNIYGGRSADKSPDPDKLYSRLLVSSVWLAAVPILGKLVILGVCAVLIFTVSTGFLIWAAFISCMIIFVFPLFLLGTVTPSLAKYAVNSLDDSGKTIGGLTAFNTIGSIIGTFLPTFVTIPAVGTAATFMIFSGILLVISLIYYISCGRKAVKCAVCAVLFTLFCIAGSTVGFAFWEDGLTYEGESVYNYLQVKDTDERTVLSTNVLFGIQSVYIKNDGLTGLYYDVAMAAPFMTDASEKDILILGMGSGTYAVQCEKYIDGVNIEGVEIDEKITRLAHEYFSLPGSVNVTEYDGRAFLNVCDKKYDVIMVDAYQDITIPFQMSTAEFFTSVREHLTDSGVMVVNMNVVSDDENGINGYLCDTIAAVFPEVYSADVSGSTNRELFALQSADALHVFEENTSLIEDAELLRLMTEVSEKLEKYESGGRILTDDKAPVELLGIKAIDGLISQTIDSYSQKLRSGGLEALFE